MNKYKLIGLCMGTIPVIIFLITGFDPQIGTPLYSLSLIVLGILWGNGVTMYFLGDKLMKADSLK